MTLAELNVKINTDTAGLQKQLDDVKKKLKDTDDVTVKSQKSVGGLVDKFKAFSVAGVGVAAAAGLIIKGLQNCIKEAAESEAITAKLNQVLKSTGQVAGVTSSEALALANSLSQVTTFEDDTIVSAEAMLLTFTKIGSEVFPQATEATLDLATMMGGDLQGAAIQVGKALNDPIQGVTALRRVGVQLSDAQERQVKSFMAVNDIASAQKIILAELATEFGGQARAATDTFSGSMKVLSNSFGEFQEAIGNFLIGPGSDFAKWATVALNAVTDFINGFRKKLLEFNLFTTETALSLNKLLNKIGIGEGATKRNEENVAQIKRQLGLLDESVKKSNKNHTATTQEESDKQKAIKDKQYADSEKMAADYTTKLLQQKGNETLLLNQAEFNAFEQLKALTTVKQTEKELIATNIAKFYAGERARYEYQKALESANKVIGIASGIASQLGSIFSMYFSNKSMLIDNDTFKQIDSLTQTYNAEKAKIEATVLDEDEKKKQLTALEEKYNENKKNIDEKAEKEKRTLQREAAKYQKAIAITQAIINTAQAVTSALAVPPPPVGWAMAAINAALGAVQIGLISNQPLPAAATGGVFNSPYIGGEAGAEIAVPLESMNGQKAIQSFASGMLDAMSESANTSATSERVSSPSGGNGGNVYLDGSLVGKWLSKGSDNGSFRLNSRVII